MQLPLFVEEPTLDTKALERCLHASVVAVDIETETRWPGQGPRQDYGLSYSAAITLLALAWRDSEILQSTVLTPPFGEEVTTFLKRLFQPERVIVAHNAVFDLRQLSKLTGGQVPGHVWDTMVMARLLHPTVGLSYSLLGVAQTLGIAYSEQHAAMKQQRASLHTVSLAKTLDYVQDDARLTLQIYERQRALDADAELVDWECRAVREYCRMAAQGIRLNIPYVRQYLDDLRQRQEVVAVRLRQDGLSNPGSSLARAKYLYRTKQIPVPTWDPDSLYFTRAGRTRLSHSPGLAVELTDLSTRSDVVESYMEEGSPYAERLKDLADYLEVDWLISTLESLLEHADVDGRLHSLVTINTDTGRRSSSNPHLQNWKMPAMAGVVVGDDDFTLVEIDYANAENMMAALIAADSHLAEACAAEDFHSTMAARYFGKTWEGADAPARKRLRTLSKKITYGTAYGMGAERLAKSIGVSVEEAQRVLRAKDAAFSDVARTREAAKNQVRTANMLTLWTGRRIALGQPFVAWNYLCQGGVSEVTKRALVRIAEAFEVRGLRSRVALDIHDALILEVAHAEWDEALELASQIMSSITPEDMNHRTTPPIHWRAEPKLAENRKKWGMFQWHPPETE